jgi:hypothetical protein
MESCPIDGINENGEEILGTFVILEDANNFVRNLCADKAVRDDPDAIFSEKMSAAMRMRMDMERRSGSTSAKWRLRALYLGGIGVDLLEDLARSKRILRMKMKARLRGMTNFAGLRNEIEFRSHRYWEPDKPDNQFLLGCLQ